MNRNELIKLGEHQVRRSQDLMLSYLEEFEKLFGRKPRCAGCTFKTDWKRFVSGNISNLPQIENMEKTFKLKRGEQHNVHTYYKDKSPVRSYGWKMTEEFAKAFLSLGTQEQLEKRKDIFEALPKVKEEKKEKTILFQGEEVFLSKATGKQLDAYAADNGIDFGEATKVKDKKKVIDKLV